MDFLEELLGLGRRGRGGRDNIADDIGDTIRGVSRWIISCGCLLVAGLVLLIALFVAGVISVGDEVILFAIVVITAIVAIASLIRNSMTGRYGR
jgi:hypothetical protein